MPLKGNNFKLSSANNKMNVIEEIKKKREFSGLPNSVVERIARIKKEDVKESRALLRKYFGVFLTNRILKGKLSADEMLEAHMSSKKRDYEKFYGEIFSGASLVGSVIDLGAGVNGFTFPYLHENYGIGEYYGIEAVGQLVDRLNIFFDEEGWGEIANAVWLDLFDVDEIVKILKKCSKPRVVFMFQVVDALENLERDFSKKFILEISKECEKIILSLPIESLGGRKKFKVQRKWLIDFLKENFEVEKDFEMNGERVLVIKTKGP